MLLWDRSDCPVMQAAARCHCFPPWYILTCGCDAAPRGRVRTWAILVFHAGLLQILLCILGSHILSQSHRTSKMLEPVSDSKIPASSSLHASFSFPEGVWSIWKAFFFFSFLTLYLTHEHLNPLMRY